MPRKAFKHLDDIRDAAQFILEVTRDRKLDDYQSDRLLRQAMRTFDGATGVSVGVYDD